MASSIIGVVFAILLILCSRDTISSQVAKIISIAGLVLGGLFLVGLFLVGLFLVGLFLVGLFLVGLVLTISKLFI